MKRFFKKNNENGFTLAELLIVVAIIAVLVAISVPIFTTQLEKAREATDAANIRAAYAEIMTAALTEDESGYVEKVQIKQKVGGWSTQIDWPEGLAGNDVLKSVQPNAELTLTFTPNGAGSVGGNIVITSQTAN